jgi:chromate reductase
MGASGGIFGTAEPVPAPSDAGLPQRTSDQQAEVMIGQAPTKFDEAGRLTDEQTKQFIRDLLQSLATWTHRLRRPAVSMAAE